MSGGRQCTLPRAWWAAGRKAPNKKKEEEESAEADDDLLLAAAAAADPDTSPVAGFCAAAGSIWIYPTNYPVRSYQVRMARAALLGNTLVCLPTGLGKTFVAAVVMYNFYRWFPSGKVLFLAPTKPLVAQQMEACVRVMGIPARHMAEMTGGTQALSRRDLWTAKRVFFLTPQIMVNDLSRGTCPAVEIKCLVIDEAHKALGNHAYCQVVRELSKYTNQFRILALSATPGSDTKAVQQVISNLLIAQIELCAEDSPEIQPYSHERQVEKIVVPLGEELVGIRNAYIQVLETFAGRLIRIGVLSRRDIPSLTKYQIILARDQYRKNPSSQSAGVHQGIIEGDFALCISLYHGYELLLQMGLRSLFIYLCGIMDGSKGLTRTKNELGHNEDFMKLYQQLRDMFSDKSSVNGNIHKNKTVFENKKEFIYSHPKLKKLEEIVIEHFKSWKKGCSDQVMTGSPSVDAVGTRVMIFSSFRDSVQEIAEMLSRLSPVVRVMTFLGHSTGKSTKGFTQKEQLEVVKRFREGGYNTLVSTCVGEEGLDIGEVDLIICFDAQKSPVRLVQRMGRTGRRRQGRIVVILAEGREERTYNQSQSNKRSIDKAISGNKMLRFYQHSPRMIPEGINPKMHKMFITAEKYEPSNSRVFSKERRSSSLQHKSALFSCVIGQKQMHCDKNWSLSSEEFEIWDRLYRIKESDGIKEPVLPQVQFETLENLEEIPKHKEEATRELSLSEWRIWQSRPFPICVVDHSDRCYHFISVMEMIELMRHEQGDCHYELEIQPHLRIEDVNVQRNKNHPFMTSSTSDQKACSSKKEVAHRSKVKPFLPDTDDNESEFFTTFKIRKPKTPKGTSRSNLEMPVLTTDTNTSASYSAGRLAVVENADQGSQEDKELEVTFDLNGFIDLCDNSDSTVIDESAAMNENKTVDKALSLETKHTDLSFTAEKSPVSSDLFYLPESYVDSFALVRPLEEPSWLKQVFSNVKRLLSQSPPSLNKVNDFENMVRNEEIIRPFQKVISDSYSARLQDSVFPAPSEADYALLHLENPEGRVTSELCGSLSTSFSKTVSSETTVKAKKELHWNDSFDSLFHNKEFTEIKENQYFAQKEDIELEKKKVVVDEEKSIHLFEDEHLYDTNNRSFSTSNKHLVRSDSGESAIGPVAEQGSEWFSSKVCCRSTDTACEEQPRSSKTTAMEMLGDVSVTEQSLNNDDLYDCSQELFSVNFDLGFSIQECENQIFEENIDTNNTRKSNGALWSHTDVKSTEDKKRLLNDNSKLETSPEWDCKGLEKRNASTPLPFQSRSLNGREGAEGASAVVPFLESGGERSGSPKASAPALSTPCRKVMDIKANRRILLNAFSSAREEIAEGPLTDKENKSLCKQNFGSSAVDAFNSHLGRTENLDPTNIPSSHVSPAEGISSESEEELVFRRKNRRKKNVLKSPDVMNDSDFESPICARKRRHPRNMSDMSSDDSMDFHKNSHRTINNSTASNKNQLRSTKRPKVKSSFTNKTAARQFLDEEAELSQQDADCVSSDETDDAENELNSSLVQFLNDDVEITQVLNDFEMKGIYLKSVRSPALGNRYKMVHREFNAMEIFSQIPEQDQAYAEDSFCVVEEEEETCKKSESSEEEVSINFDFLNNENFTNGRKQYLTRRRQKVNQASMEENYSAPMQKKKLSRIVVLSDSSGEETSVINEKPMKTDCVEAQQENAKLPKSFPSVFSAQHKEIARESTVHHSTDDKSNMLLGLKASVSEMLDFHPDHQVRSFSPAITSSALGKENLQASSEVVSSLKNGSRSTSVPSCSTSKTPSSRDPLEKKPSLCVLVDSREISSGAEVISSLKAVHAVKVQVCTLSSSDYIVSNRMAVERMFLSELLNSMNRTKVTQRIQCLQSMFERTCVVVETDRIKPGETSRFFQRTRYYDSMLSAFVQAGIRILFSSCQEETASLLKDLALVEQRKNAAIHVPVELEGHKKEILNFYLSIPNLSYPAALSMCHYFDSIKKMANSSPTDIATAAQVSPQKAEEIYRYLHCGFDMQMLPENLCTKGKVVQLPGAEGN
ncbi:Fanconi anemia group M protein isoform X1 [Neopsephotus bourkii]|uniref:Fanconi anemia group M protein isoform X1 n=1 Tax=Neopsephotus bourkii TaxID=309878 RepID=UPI002AA56030|nr:Fanconi anemia group M protein isoform X1 [Neopsephotus bourkii]